MAFMRNINDFILTLVALSLPSIAATIDCNGKPFHCLNSTHFMICVDFGSGVSSTMDDFIIPCPPTTVCQATNRFECEFPTVTTTPVTPVATNSPLAATVNTDVVIDTVSDVTTIPFEEYFNTISTTTVSEGYLITRDAVTTELPVNNLSESFNVPAIASIINKTAINVGVSPNSFTTLATLDLVTDETTVTEIIPNATENVNIIFKPNSNISEALPNATEIDVINLGENNTVDATENYELNSTLLETIIGATNFGQFNTPVNNLTSYNVTEPIVSEATESIIGITSPDLVLDNITIENVTKSISTKPTEYKDLIQHQSNSTLNETVSTGDNVQSDFTALDINGSALNVNHSGLSSNEITTKYEEQISTAEPILFEVKDNTVNIPVDEQDYQPTFNLSPNVFLYDQTIDNATESTTAATTVYKPLIESQNNRFNNKQLDNSTSYDIAEPILSDVTESIISIPVDDKEPYLSTLDASPDVVLGVQTVDDVTETVLAVPTDYKHLTESQSNLILNKPKSGGDIVQNDTTKLNTVLKTNENVANMNKTDSYSDVFSDDSTIDTVTEPIPAETTEYKRLIESQSNLTLYETTSSGGIVHNDTTKHNTVLNIYESALNVNNYDLYFKEITTKYEEQKSTTEPILNEAKENKLKNKQTFMTTLDVSPDVFLDNITIDTVTESILETTEYRHSIESQNNSTLNGTMSSGDVEQRFTTTAYTILNTNGFASNARNSDLSLNEDTTSYYEEQISTAQNKLELSGNTGAEITQLDVTEMANITKPMLSISTIATFTVNNEPISTYFPNAAIQTDAAGEVTVKLNVIEFENKTNIFDDMQTTELSFKDSNHYLNSTEDSVTVSTLDHRSVNPENNTSTTHSENLKDIKYVENFTKIETDTGEINFVLPKPPTSNETITIVHSSADNTSTTYTIPNIDTIIAQNKTALNISVRTDESFLTSEYNVKDKTADSTEKKYLLKPVTEPTSTPLSKNVLGSDLTNRNLKEMSTFINSIQLTPRGNVTNETLTQNVIGSDMINGKKIALTPSNHFELSNRVSGSTVGDQNNTFEIFESTSNDISETEQEVDSFTYSNLYYQTDTEEISHDHDQGVPRNNILSGDTTERTSSILVLTTESTKDPHFDAVLEPTTPFNSVSDQMYAIESDHYLTSTKNSPQPEATVSTAFNSTNSAVETSQLVTRKNEVKKISTTSSKLKITSAIKENSNVAMEQNILTTDITNSPKQTAITSSTEFVTKHSAVNQVGNVTRQVADEQISTEPSKLEMTSAINDYSNDATEQNIPTIDITNSPQLTATTSSTAFVTKHSAVNQVRNVTRQVADEKISTEPLQTFTINKTTNVATEQNNPSAEVTPVPADLITDRFKNTSETANYLVHQESRITIVSDSSKTKPTKSSAISAQNNRGIKETLLATTTSNAATDLSAISNLTVSNLSDAGVTNFREEKRITVVDVLTSETTIDAKTEANKDNVLEKYPITIKKEVINPENISNSIKTNTTTEDNTVAESLRSYSIQRENISKQEITSVVTDQTILASFIADDVNYTENQNKLPDSVRVFNEQAKPTIPEILPERFGANEDPNSSVNKATVLAGLTSMNTAVAADTKLTWDETNQPSSKKLVAPKMSTKEPLSNDFLKKEIVLPVMPELKTNPELIVKTPKSNDAINTNPIITTETSTSFTTSIQDSKYQSNLVPSTESWRATVITEPVVQPTRPYTETLITSSKPYTVSNDQMSQDVTSLTPKLNIPNQSEKQYNYIRQNIETADKNVLTSLEPSVTFPQVTESSGVANEEVETSYIRISTTQKSYGVDTLKLVQNQGESTENNFMTVTPLASPSTKTKLVTLPMKQSFTAPNTHILSEQQGSTTQKLKVYVIPITSPSVNYDKPLVDVTAVPILKSSNKLSKDVADVPDDQIRIITAVYNSNSTVKSVPKTEFNKVQLNIRSTTEKTTTQSSDLDIVMVDIVNALSNLGEIATGSNNTHSGMLSIKKSTSQQVEKPKTEDVLQTEKEEKPENEKKEKPVTEKKEKPETEKKEEPEVAETNPLNGKIELLTSTQSIPINKQANVQHDPQLNIKQTPVQNATTSTRQGNVENTTARYNSKTKSSVTNTHNSTHPASVTSKHNFVCKSNNRGRFSDNGDCRKFYICIGKHEPIKGICPNNTVFSELRKQCTKNLSHCVRNNQFQCVSEGRFSDYLNDNIYYICVNNKANRFIRFKLQCQNGYHLNKTSVRCVMNTESILSTSQQSQQSASEVSTSNQSISAKSEKIKEKPKTNKKFECKKSGKFPEPNDCRKYYVCTKLEKSEYRQRTKKCDSDEVYNRDKKKCVDADSYECS